MISLYNRRISRSYGWLHPGGLKTTGSRLGKSFVWLDTTTNTEGCSVPRQHSGGDVGQVDRAQEQAGEAAERAPAYMRESLT